MCGSNVFSQSAALIIIIIICCCTSKSWRSPVCSLVSSRHLCIYQRFSDPMDFYSTTWMYVSVKCIFWCRRLRTTFEHLQTVWLLPPSTCLKLHLCDIKIVVWQQRSKKTFSPLTDFCLCVFFELFERHCRFEMFMFLIVSQIFQTKCSKRPQIDWQRCLEMKL